MSTGDTEPAVAARTGSGAGRGGWWRWLGVAGLCLAIWGGLALVWPLWEKHRAYEIVAEHFRWNEKEKSATVREESTGTGPGALREIDRRMARALRVVGTRSLVISSCPGITNVAALGDIATLQQLTFLKCKGLTSVAGLPPGVQVLQLSLCPGLTNVAGLPPGVQELHLWGCPGLTSVEGLPAGVQVLYLWGCPRLISAQELPPAVQTLTLNFCSGLTSVAGLPPGVKRLYLTGCTDLTEVGTLPPGLKEVNMWDTPKLPEAVKAEIRALVKKNGGEVIE